MERRTSVRQPEGPMAESEARPAGAASAGAGRGVRFEHVDLTFGGGKNRRTVQALNDVSFAVEDRENEVGPKAVAAPAAMRDRFCARRWVMDALRCHTPCRSATHTSFVAAVSAVSR